MNCIFNTFLMMPSTKQGKSNNPPPSPSKDSLDELSELIRWLRSTYSLGRRPDK